MNGFRKRLIAGIVSLGLLATMGSLIGVAQETTSPAKTVIRETIGGNVVEYTKTECTPNTAAEQEFSPVGGYVHQWGTEWFYFMDGYATRTYTFRGEIGQTAYLLLDLSQEFLVSVSTDNATWTECLNANTDGRFRELRSIDLTPWFTESETVYVKIGDSIPTTGWGGQIRALRYVTVTGTNSLPAWQNISDGWQTSVGTTVNAGQAVTANVGSSVSFTKTITVPNAWIGGELAVSFSWVESGSKPVVRVNGETVDSISTYGNNLTIPLPTDSNGKQVEVEVTTTATEEGKCGLWDAVRIGYSDAVTLPESSWTFDGKTAKIHENYYTEGSNDVVQLNALAGNYASNLLDPRYNLLGFNNMVRESISNTQLFYAHDSSRTLTALAFEEIYSPIVRLDTIEALYKGVRSAMVPGSDYEIFLKRDARPRNVMPATEGELSVLRMQTHQDVSGQFADVYAVPVGKDATAMTVNDELGETTVHRQYQADSQSVQVDATWYAGDTDKPTTLVFSGDGTSDYRVVFNNFQIPFSGNLAKYNTLSTQNKEYMGANTLTTKEITPPAEQYLALSGKLTWTEHPTIITWDIAPKTIRVVTDPDNSYIAALEFVYDTAAKPTMTALNFDGVDVELKWPYQVANNIVTKGIYGANGFDPTYVCGSEGLGTAALAAAAYIFEKYEHPLANQAKELALQASRSAYNASHTLNHTPSFYLDRVQAAYFLCLMGYQAEFAPIADYYGQYVLREQQANGDGSTNWFDGRMPLTMQVLDEIVDSADYANALKWYLTSITYYDDHLEYKGQSYTGGSFSGAGEISYLAHMGDTETMAKVMNLTP
ncbi:MAG: hypothetical protein IKT68_03055, partial [Clostridia bacterium]|nr:hypothetical protein [Clostridia bacterium]